MHVRFAGDNPTVTKLINYTLVRLALIRCSSALGVWHSLCSAACSCSDILVLCSSAAAASTISRFQVCSLLLPFAAHAIRLSDCVSAVAGSLPEAAGLSISAKEYAAKVRLHAAHPPHSQTICLAVDFKRCATSSQLRSAAFHADSTLFVRCACCR